jgi:hypothetical protein
MGPLPQALEIIFEMQMKKISEKIIAFQLTKPFFLFFFFSFWTPPTFKPHNFLNFYSF